MNRKLIWWLATILTFALFYSIIPVATYNAAPLFFSFVGAALLIIFLVQALWNFRSFSSFNKPTPEEKHTGHKLAPFMVIPGLIMIFVFYFNFKGNVKNELKKFGIKTNATVVDGTSSVGRKSSSYKLNISYITKSGVQMDQEIDVSSSEFHDVYKGEEVPIIYSSKNPEIVELIISDDAVSSYMGIENRGISLADMYKLLDLNSNTDSITRLLNLVSYKWEFKPDSGRYFWSNNQRDEIIILSRSGAVTHVGKSSVGHDSISNAMQKDGFKKISKNDGVEIYENKQYRIAFQEKISTEGEMPGLVHFVEQIIKKE